MKQNQIPLAIPIELVDVIRNVMRPLVAELVAELLAERGSSAIASTAQRPAARPEDPQAWMTVKEAAEYLRIHPKTVLRLLASEQITAGTGLVGYQVTTPNGTWRIHRDDADAYQRRSTSRYGIR